MQTAADATLVIGLSLTLAWVVAIVLGASRGVLRGAGLIAALWVGGALVCLTLYAGVVRSVADSVPPATADGAVLAWFVAHRSHTATFIMRAVSTVGGTLGMLALATIGVAALVVAHHRGVAVVAAAAAASACVLIPLTKDFYQRERPPMELRLTVETTSSLPSGHALGSLATLGILAVAVVTVSRSPTLRGLAVASAALGVLSIGVSRLYLGVHWLTDVLAGWLLGAALVALGCAALTLLRRGTPAPLPPQRTPVT